ncbi:N-acetylmuramoyl-L-alanine amidase [Microbacteriaceae bacterium 4G12]
MKMISKLGMTGVLLVGSASLVPSVAGATSAVQVSQPTSNVQFPGFDKMENGKYSIESAGAPGKVSLSVYSNMSRTGEYLLYNTQNITMYNSVNGSSAGPLAPQVLVATQRKGEWFLINTSIGPKWVYHDSTVQIRDLDKKNANLILDKSVSVYTQPFSVYSTGETIQPQTVKVIKQAGDWYLINRNGSSVWIYSETAKYAGTIATFDTNSIYGVSYNKSMLVPLGNDNVRPGSTLLPTYITVHNTDNTAIGANAEMHGRYLLNQVNNPDANASWHFTVDDKQIVQHIPMNEVAWHAGDGDGIGNRSSISIEIAENADGNYAQAEANAKKLIAFLMYKLNVPIENVKPHQNWSGKYCPAMILDNGWSTFINSVKQVYDANNTQLPAGTKGWIQLNGVWYYADPQTGQKTTGWLSYQNKWYYLDATGAMKTGWVSDQNKWYFLDATGVMHTGLVYIGNAWYYFDATGAMQTGWVSINSKWYYFDGNGVKKTGWITVGNNKYFLDATGVMHTGLVYVGNAWYYFDASGAMKTGWVFYQNNWYYFDGSGAMKTGWLLLGNTWYYLYSDGHMAANTTIDGYRLGSDGAWIK